jgi:hypothetical protein
LIICIISKIKIRYTYMTGAFCSLLSLL